MRFISVEEIFVATHVLIDGQEVSQRAVKAKLAFAAMIFSALCTAVVVFVLLPLINLAITLSAGLVFILLIAAVSGMTTLVFSAAIVAWCFGPPVMCVEKSYQAH